MQDKTFQPNQDLQTLNEAQFSLLNNINEEYHKGFIALNSLGSYTVTFYGGSRVKPEDKAYHSVYELAKEFGKLGWGVVSGGGPGIMTAALEGAKNGGGKAIAFCISIKDEEVQSKYPDVSLMFHQFSARKYMLRQSDVFIFAPGGIGTLDELMEILTLISTGKSPKKAIYLLDSQFWQGYMSWFKEVLLNDRKVISSEIENLFTVVDTVDDVFDKLFPRTDESNG